MLNNTYIMRVWLIDEVVSRSSKGPSQRYDWLIIEVPELEIN
jgi:hypothetical protein